ncbi:DUF2357 domain-containing protein, partial [bacterium]|nr:DUF2357 domain-containing protein [bacterium]
LNYKETEDELFYPKFYDTLRNELIEYCLSFPFHYFTPTYHIVEETHRPPSFLFLFHYFKNNHEKIKQAFSIIFNQPYKRLRDERRWVNIARVKEIDQEVIRDILVHSERWAETMISVPLSEMLKVQDKRHLPTQVLQREKYETYDVPENRFVKFFWMRLLSWLDEVIRTYEKELGSDKLRDTIESFQSLKWELQSYQREPLIEEAGEMHIFPANSTVLMRRDGYRELLQLYREFLLSYYPIFADLENALEARDIATLYEFWCFFKIANLLEKVLGKGELKFQIERLAEGFKVEETKVCYGNGKYKLVYNKRFGHGNGGSYSIPLQPDFVIMNNKKAILALDAKFRFKPISGGEGKPSTQKDIDEIDVEKEEQEALNKRDIERIAKLEDIFKMHTYKDALGLKAAIIVYPGTEWMLFRKPKECQKPEKFGSEKDNKIEQLPFGFEGVGYIPLIPGSEDNDYILIECLKRTLN